jgi:glycosyltransferase involved in cell wall biosynthesis
MAMIVHSHYEEDPRVRREAESLVQRGRAVDVFALRRAGEPSDETIGGVHVRRLGVERHQGAGIRTYLREYSSFLVRAGWAVTRAHRQRHYAVVQVHSLPDFLIFSGLALRLVGVPLLLDLHEAMPEFFEMRFPRSSGGLAHRLLLAQERLSIGLSSAVITVNQVLADRLTLLGVPAGKVSVILNSPSLLRFNAAVQPARAFMADGVLRLVYAGALTPIYELDVVIRSMSVMRGLRPGLQLEIDIYGRGDDEPALRRLVDGLDLQPVVRFHGRIPIAAVPAAIAAADIGLAPTVRNRFTEMSLSTKLFEYGAMERPIVASALPLVDQMFPPGAITTYRPGDPDDLAAAVLRLVDDPTARDRAVGLARGRISELAWEHEADRLVELVDRLARDHA